MHMVAKPSIVILHGANGTATIMRPLANELRTCADPISLNMLGHGGREVPESVSFASFAADVIAQMDARGVERAYIFGFSSGGTTALYLARHYPERFIGVATLAAKYLFDARTIEHWTYLCDPERLARPGNTRAEELESDHRPQDWKKVTLLNRRFFVDLAGNAPLGDDDLRAITMPALIFSSNQDQIVPLEETVALAKLMPNAKPVVFHGQCHPFHVVPIPAIVKAICNWIGETEKANAASD
jgi:pimeloyl-ACP methyl ester carboxylesterase